MKHTVKFSPAGLPHSARPTPVAGWISNSLLLLIGLAMANVGIAQQLDPNPPAQGSPIDIRMSQLKKRLQQPPPPPAGGFWVVEDRPGQKSPALVSYYTDQQQLIVTDTLANVRLNISRHAVVNRLNRRLNQLLDTYPATLAAMRQPIR